MGQCASGAGRSATSLPIVPVKVKAKGSNKTALTYALICEKRNFEDKGRGSRSCDLSTR